MDHLEQLEHRSVHILREAYAAFKNLCMLWSIGKDSTVLLWLARKAFFGHVPLPLVHIDTSFKIPEMIAYRDRLAADWNLNLIYGQNVEALAEKRTFPDGAVDRLTCCWSLKTEALKKTLSGEWPRFRFNHATRTYEQDRNTEPFTGVIVGARADEEGSRSKERYFSPRNAQSTWDIAEQPPEFWNQYKTDFAPGYSRTDSPPSRLDRAEHLGIHRGRADSGGRSLLRHDSHRHPLPIAGLWTLHQTGRLDGSNRRRHRPRAENRQVFQYRRTLRPGAGRRRRRRAGDTPSGRLHVGTGFHTSAALRASLAGIARKPQ